MSQNPKLETDFSSSHLHMINKGEKKLINPTRKAKKKTQETRENNKDPENKR